MFFWISQCITFFAILVSIAICIFTNIKNNKILIKNQEFQIKQIEVKEINNKLYMKWKELVKEMQKEIQDIKAKVMGIKDERFNIAETQKIVFKSYFFSTLFI